MNGTSGAVALVVDRLVLTGATITPERAERLRGLLELEIRNGLSRQGLPNDLRDAAVLTVPTMSAVLGDQEWDGATAVMLAEQVLRAVRRAG
jgi:hypothetical protein